MPNSKSDFEEGMTGRLVMEGGNRQRKDNHRMVKRVLELTSLLCLATALFVYLFSEKLGFSEDTAFFVSIAFLAAGVGDFIVLKLWDRITAQR